MLKRIGFCCDYFHHDQTLSKKLLEEIERPRNTRATTVRWLNEHKDQAEEKLAFVFKHNIEAIKNLIIKVAELPESRRMCRISSGILPCATENTWRYYWDQPDIIKYCEQHFAEAGALARLHNVKISFHPGQYTVLASDSADIVDRSVDEFEYHARMASWMGFGKKWQDGCKINVHISGRQGPEGIVKALPRLSTEARNLITIENDEYGWGLDATLQLEKHVALVLDIHHHLIRAEEHLNAQDDRVKRVIDSWRGVRPTMHYSYFRDEYLLPAFVDRMELMHSAKHNVQDLLLLGCKKQKLRAHSDMLPNAAVNAWALSFLQSFDIQVEAKSKNLAAEQLWKQAVESGVI